MHPFRLTRRISFTSVFVAAVVMVTNLSANELNDGNLFKRVGRTLNFKLKQKAYPLKTPGSMVFSGVDEILQVCND